MHSSGLLASTPADCLEGQRVRVRTPETRYWWFESTPLQRRVINEPGRRRYLVALLLQRFGQSSHAFAGPPQRQFRIPPCRRFDQRLEIRDQGRVLDNRRLSSCPRPPHSLPLGVLPPFLQAPPRRARG